jgi:hypothetical protein
MTETKVNNDKECILVRPLRANIRPVVRIEHSSNWKQFGHSRQMIGFVDKVRIYLKFLCFTVISAVMRSGVVSRKISTLKSWPS